MMTLESLRKLTSGINHLRQYQYKHLPSPTAFRVLELLPGKQNEELCYRLHVVDWTDPPNFEAISYAWGDPDLQVSSICDGKELRITPNLRDGLLQFRYADQSRMLWADAVCIDQLNIKERGHQVSNMQQIYQKATGVLAWLGLDERGLAETAMNFVEDLSAHLCQEAGVETSRLKEIPDLITGVLVKTRRRPADLTSATEANWISLKWLFSKPWFSRLWVIQEVNSNNNILVICGSRHVNWEKLALVANCVSTLFEYHTGRYRFADSHCWHAAAMRSAVFSTGSSWLGMLEYAAAFSTTDLRDRVFGLLALPAIANQSVSLEADYAKSTFEVYRNVVEVAIQNYGNLLVLVYVSFIETSEYPSWIPRWDIYPAFHYLGRTYPLWNADGAEKLVSFSINPRTNVMDIAGISIDTIVISNRLAVMELFTTTQSEEDTPVSRKHFWTTVFQHATTFARPGQDTITACSMAVTYGLNRQPIRAGDQARRADFLPYLASVFDDLPARYPDIQSKLEAEGGGKAAYFQKDVLINTFERRLFVTQSGHIGCGLVEILPGDVLCIIFGSRVPLVLRPKENYYLLVSAVYVYGIMDGEAMAAWKAGEMPDIEEQVFEIH